MKAKPGGLRATQQSTSGPNESNSFSNSNLFVRLPITKNKKN